jgi:ATP-dependent Clp protease adaptor protein ClpS
MAAANPLPDVLPDIATDTETDTKVRRQPPYAVILHNDDINTMEFVVEVLRKVFGYTVEKCVKLMVEAHEKGRAVVWIGTLEVAELKADQIRSCGCDPHQKTKGAQPLGVSIEPVA